MNFLCFYILTLKAPKSQTTKVMSAKLRKNVSSEFYYIPINNTPVEMHVFWPYDTERRIKLTFSEFVTLSLKTKLMTLLNNPQETSRSCLITLKNEISFEEKVYNKLIIITVTSSDALWIFPDLMNHTRRSASCAIL